MMIAAAEESARAKVKVEATVKPAAPKTIVRALTGVALPSTILEEKGAGHLKELVIKNTDENYRLRIYVDGTQLYDGSYSWFKNLSQITEEIAAFQDENGDHILHITDIKWTKNIKIEAEPLITTLTQKQKLKQLFYKVEIFI